MGLWLGIGVRLGLRVGILGGVIAGLVAGLGGILFIGTLPDLLVFATDVFWILVLLLPVVYWLTLLALMATSDATRTGIRTHSYRLTAISWLPAYLACVVAFMIPVVIVPVVFNRGVTLNTAAHWYDQVFTQLSGGPVLWVGLATLIGFGACLLYTSPSPRDGLLSRMPSSA